MIEADYAVEAARAAGCILRERLGGDFKVRHKGDVDLVTEVDLACERAILEVLTDRTPDIPVLGEEGGGAVDAPTRWVVDPLDGTTNFVHGFPMFAVSVGLEIDGRPAAGAIDDPSRNRLYRAHRGGGAFCNDQPIAVSDVDELSESLIATGFAYDRRERADFYLAHLKAAMMHAQGVRRTGSAALDLAHVADGTVEAFWEYNLRPWDVVAGLVLIEEAGGRLGALPGASLKGDWPGPLVSNGRMHDALDGLFEGVAASPA